MNNGSIFLELVKKSVNRLNEEIVHNQLDKLARKAIGLTLHGKGWKNGIAKVKVSENGFYLYTASIKFVRTCKREYPRESFDRQLDTIRRKLYSAGKQFGWYSDIRELGTVKVKTEIEDIGEGLPSVKVDVTLPAEIEPHFSHIFDRSPQIRIIHGAIKTAVESNFRVRHHCLAFGRPACAKTEVLLAFERMLGKGSVIKLDATATSKAGVEKLLFEVETVPPFLVIEEIEKCNPVNLPVLLGIMDSRGELRKTNYRVGSIQREARCLVLATANNLELFNSIMSGALSSRFAHKVFFPRPSRAVLEKILAREVEAIGGKHEWIKPALDYCIDTEGSNDPRRCISVCLDGKDRLLGKGEYQADLQAIREAMKADMGEGFKM